MVNRREAREAERAADEWAAMAKALLLSDDDLTILEALAVKRRTGGMSHGPDLPFTVYCQRSGTAERKVVGKFSRYIEAEVFIHSELLKCANFGTDTGRFWGSGGEGGDIHYWIESPQEIASVRAAG